MDIPEHAPPVELPPGCRAMNLPESMGYGKNFVHGDAGGRRLRAAYFVREADSHFLGRVWFGPEAEGPPGHAHGGSISAVIDEAMGFSCWVAGHTVVAASMSIQFKAKLPLGTDAYVHGWVTSVSGKKVTACGILHGGDESQPFATGEGLYIVQSAKFFERMINAAPHLAQLGDPSGMGGPGTG